MVCRTIGVWDQWCVRQMVSHRLVLVVVLVRQSFYCSYEYSDLSVRPIITIKQAKFVYMLIDIPLVSGP